ncbi:hypothetical protein ACN20G_16590 [Streptomyces sp. BI20]|uniref:hypothetical protein n=1 Tax=Streptomyces sp. BI20 TaxID=3403460 RepID=UPI003C76A655
MSAPEPRKLGWPQWVVLAAAMVPMLGVGAAGGIGTYSNIKAAYSEGTALGAVAAGEGATAVLALLMLGVTMLGQATPTMVRVGLWALPAAGSVMGAMSAPDLARTVIYAITPMGMVAAAEGLAFLARRIVVHTAGRDADAEARAAALTRRLAYHWARAANHPDAKLRRYSERAAWRLARRVGTGDTDLGDRLVTVQRDRVQEGADGALAAMFALPVTLPDFTVTTAVTALPPTAPDLPGFLEVDTARHAEDTQVTPGIAPEQPAVDTAVTLPVTEAVTPVDEPSAAEVEPMVWTVEDQAWLDREEPPVPGVTLTDGQIVTVLRHLRDRTTPPSSYRDAATAYRDAGYVGSEARLRAAWAALTHPHPGTEGSTP